MKGWRGNLPAQAIMKQGGPSMIGRRVASPPATSEPDVGEPGIAGQPRRRLSHEQMGAKPGTPNSNSQYGQLMLTCEDTVPQNGCFGPSGGRQALNLGVN